MEEQEKYLQLMKVARSRLDAIDFLLNCDPNDFNRAEIIAFHGRKIIEAIAFGCLIGVKNGIKVIPRDAIGQYNAESIFKSLKRKRIEIFPSPSIIRPATEQELVENNTKIVIEGIADRRITKEELISMYRSMHEWLHELNPYTKDNHEDFYKKHYEQLLSDTNRLGLFLLSHQISLNGEAFFCTLKDKNDGEIKIVSLSKLSY